MNVVIKWNIIKFNKSSMNEEIHKAWVALAENILSC